MLFALLFGAGNGVLTIVSAGLMPQYFGRTHVGRIGGALSVVSLVARAAAPLAAAWLLLALPGTASWWRCWPLLPRMRGWRFWRRGRQRARAVARG